MSKFLGGAFIYTDTHVGLQNAANFILALFLPLSASDVHASIIHRQVKLSFIQVHTQQQVWVKIACKKNQAGPCVVYTGW